jgi:oligoendopeptidase F
MTLFAIWTEWGLYWATVDAIYTFTKPEQLTTFVSLTQHFQWSVTTMLLAYLGIQTAENFSNAASAKFESVAQNFASSTKSEVKTENVQRIVLEYADRYKDDPSYRPIQPDTEEAFR